MEGTIKGKKRPVGKVKKKMSREKRCYEGGGARRENLSQRPAKKRGGDIEGVAVKSWRGGRLKRGVEGRQGPQTVKIKECIKGGGRPKS